MSDGTARVGTRNLQCDSLAGVLALQKAANLGGGPLPAATRIKWLDRLIGMMVDHKLDIAHAVDQDFGGRSREATLTADVFAVLGSLKYAKANLHDWMKPVAHEGIFPDAVARVEFQPLGVVGLISPWNFPFNLTFAPLAGIVAAGNRCMIKTSEFTPNSSELIKKMIVEAFDPSEIAVFNGGPDVAQAFTRLSFDHLLYTGGGAVAKQVMRAAAENLVPVTLELGGKCPVIVSATASIEDAANRLMTIKTLNAGQICLAPDYVLVPENQVDNFKSAAAKAVAQMYPTLAGNPDYTSIINQSHYNRLQRHLADAKEKGADIVELNPANESFSGNTRRIPPTLIVNPTEDMTVMQEEIFGPLLPVKTYRGIDDAIGYVNGKANPLALYYFGGGEEERRVLDRTRSGGVTVNDVMTHAFAEGLPFGGTGASGMGSYHGKAGFMNFSHARSVYQQSRAIEAEYMIKPPFGDQLRGFLDVAISKA
jgi:coniferyl-aldehyde dehydrogenase